MNLFAWISKGETTLIAGKRRRSGFLLKVAALILAACIAEAEHYELPRVDANGYRGPAVLAADPPAGSHGVPLDYPVRITFQTRIVSTGLSSAVSAVSARGESFPVTASLSDDARTLILSAIWPARDRISVTVDAGVTDELGLPLRDQNIWDGEPFTPFRLSFQTGAALTEEAASILEQAPLHGSRDVVPTVTPTIHFSKRMNPASAAIRIESKGKPVPHGLRWENDRTLVRILPDEPLMRASLYQIFLDDLCDSWGIGLRLPSGPIAQFTTKEAEGKIVINEVVTDPKSDWNDTAGGNGIPFDAIPGNGSITTSDEFIELYNGSDEAIDLTGWTLEQIDGTDQIHEFGKGGTATEIFSSPTSSIRRFEAGTYMVIGNPVGDNKDNVLLILRDRLGLERDRVQLGGDGAPSGKSSGPHDEAVARVPNGVDTGSNAADFMKVPATPLLPN